MASFKNLVSTTSAQISSGGTISGDLVINGDLQVDGGGSLSFDEIIEGTQVIDVTNTEALLVRKNSDGGDVFIVDTTNTRVGLGNTPEVNFHIKLADTANARIEDTSSDGTATLDFKNDQRTATIGVYGDDSDSFKIDHGGGTVITIDTNQEVGINNTTPQAKLDIVGANGTVSGTPDADGDEFVIRNNADAGMSILAGESSGHTSSIIFGSASDLNGANVFYEYHTKTLKLGTQHSDGILTLRSGNGANALTINSSQKVQIGTAGNVTDVPLMVNDKILIHQDSGAAGDSELTFDRRHDGAVARIQAKAGASGAMGTELHFVTKLAGGSEGTALVLDDNQKIGVGTTTPMNTMQINQSAADGDNGLLIVNEATTISEGDFLGGIGFDGNDGAIPSSVLEASCFIGAYSDVNASAGDKGGNLVFGCATKNEDDDTVSTEYMRISSAGDIGIGVLPNANFKTYLYDNTNSADAWVLNVYQDGVGGNGARIDIDSTDASDFILQCGANGGSTEVLNVMANNRVGIGTTSADTNLHVHKASAGTISAHSDAVLTVENSGTTAISILSGNSNHGQIHFGDDGQNDDGVVGYDQATNKFYILTNHSTTKRLIVDANGNTGFNVTPDSGWLSTRTALQIGGGGAIFGRTAAGSGSDISIGVNVYQHSGGSYRRIDEDVTTLYRQYSGAHEFKVAASSTDNSTITYTDVAKFDINSRISLSNNDSGTQNTVFGHSAGLNIDAGTNYNTFIGYVSAGGATLDDAINNTAVGYATLNALTTGDGNVAVGTNAGLLIDAGEANICIGNRAGDGFDAENYNIFIGEDAGGGAINGADKCIAIGKAALDGAITTDGTIAIGHDALGALTSGSGCTAVGFESLDANDEGLGLTAFGYQSLSAQTGATNGATAIGHRALHSNNYNGTNDYSVAIGFESGDNQTSGFKNTFLGASTTGNDATAENQTVVGYHAQGQADNSVTLGNADVTAVYMAEDSGATVYADKYMSTTMPAFLVHPSTSQNAFAENAAVTVVMGTERFDQGTNFASNTFTAPVTGRYQFNVQIQIKDAEIAYTYYQLILATSNVNYVSTIDPRSFDQDVTLLPLGLSIIADMDASDTAYVQILAGGTAGGASHDLLEQSYFSGYLVC